MTKTDGLMFYSTNKAKTKYEVFIVTVGGRVIAKIALEDFKLFRDSVGGTLNFTTEEKEYGSISWTKK
ncbi:MAG TPA: hypothetical protein PLW34_02180 [Termitinemataceae bacterium]|nr:hypothetical protein [Termitinemataceae bacterium]HOM23548.1 hypothetical protein [Termitinemataceae bacterium]HPP99661.1 hypothetical protein [Termitinemataceae bacterium]